MNISKINSFAFGGEFQIHGADSKKEVKKIYSKYKEAIKRNKELSISTIEFMQNPSIKEKITLLPQNDKIIFDTIRDLDGDVLYLQEPTLVYEAGYPNSKNKIASKDQYCKVSNKKGEFDSEKITAWLNYLLKKQV